MQGPKVEVMDNVPRYQGDFVLIWSVFPSSTAHQLDQVHVASPYAEN